jgi:hypothetical protein
LWHLLFSLPDYFFLSISDELDFEKVSHTNLHGGEVILMEDGAGQNGIDGMVTSPLKHIKCDPLRTEEQTPWEPRGGRIMKDLTLREDRTLPGVAEDLGVGLQDIRRSEDVSWLERLFKELKASFNAPFQSDWENKTSGLHWKEWGKL